MTKKTLTVTINKPIEVVFEASINPSNTPLWIDTMAEEQTSEWPVKLGTKYKNRGHAGDWTDYTVSKLKLNQLFELSQDAGDYRVEYIYTAIAKDVTDLQYTEWVESGELQNPLTMETLNKLKNLIESR
jgi:uncharacterized protein YndB with AHSA1/START domain